MRNVLISSLIREIFILNSFAVIAYMKLFSAKIRIFGKISDSASLTRARNGI